MLRAITAILACQLAGEAVVVSTGLPFPGPVIGMVILFAALFLRGTIGTELERVGDALLSNLSLLFVPAGVGVITNFGPLQADIVPLATALVVPTALTIAVTGLVMKWLDRTGNTDNGDDEPETRP